MRESKPDAYSAMSPRRKELLLARFKTVPNIRTRTPEELAEIPGISRLRAERFLTWMREN